MCVEIRRLPVPCGFPQALGLRRERSFMMKNGKSIARAATAGASLANGFWASLAQGPGHTSPVPVLMAVAAVWAGYFSLAWLVQGMRS